jgi:flap endonuclease-1
MHDYDMDLTFVFDGKPPQLKQREIEKRKETREKAAEEWQAALKKGDYASAFSKAVTSSRLTRSMVEDSKRLLRLLGIPFVQAPSEGEAQCAYMASKQEVWAASSKDYDSLLFGAPRLLRYLTISGREFLPSKGISRPLKPELIELDKLLAHWRISRQGLIDLAILIGTDFNEGLKGLGPKKAMSLIQKYGSIEGLPEETRTKMEEQDYRQVERVFLHPDVTEDYSVEYGVLDEDGLLSFLSGERDFSRDRVETVIRRMKAFCAKKNQSQLGKWLQNS